MRVYALIGLYLSAIVAANLSVAAFGPSAAIVNAFLFIGLDLASRDSLHDAWAGRGLAWRMATLIAIGSLLSYLINRGAGRIALASCAAFAASAVADGVVYAGLRRRRYLERAQGSNIAGAAVDSLIFPALAFGLPLLWPIVIGQFAAKVAGGLAWSLVLAYRRRAVA